MKKVLLLLVLTLVFCTTNATADSAYRAAFVPFKLIYETQEDISFVKGKFILSKQISCLESEECNEKITVPVECDENNSCYGSYGLSEPPIKYNYIKFILEFSDKIRESPIYKTADMEWGEEVTVKDSEIVMAKLQNYSNEMILPVLISILIIFALIIFLKRKEKQL